MNWNWPHRHQLILPVLLLLILVMAGNFAVRHDVWFLIGFGTGVVVGATIWANVTK